MALKFTTTATTNIPKREMPVGFGGGGGRKPNQDIAELKAAVDTLAKDSGQMIDIEVENAKEATNLVAKCRAQMATEFYNIRKYAKDGVWHVAVWPKSDEETARYNDPEVTARREAANKARMEARKANSSNDDSDDDESDDDEDDEKEEVKEEAPAAPVRAPRLRR